MKIKNIKNNAIAIAIVGMLFSTCFFIVPVNSSATVPNKLSKMAPSSVERNRHAASPISSIGQLFQGFEDGVMPPPGGWYTLDGNTIQPWTIVDAVTYPLFVNSGNYAAWINYDNYNYSNNWLVSPNINLTGYVKANLTFWAESDTNYTGATMKLYIRGDGINDTIWDMIQDEIWPQEQFEYREKTFDLSAYVDKTINISWRYVGIGGESFGLDDISVKTNDVLIYINKESPTKNAIGVSINQPKVSVNISAIKQIVTSDVCVIPYVPFTWKIGGDNVTTNSSSGPDTQGRKNALINGPLYYNTKYHWYVNVSAENVYKNVSFSFTTELPPNQPPVANYTYKLNDLNVAFTSTASDPNGYIANWTWNFDDGTPLSFKSNPQHTYVDERIYNVTLTVKDDDGVPNSITKKINVTNNPPFADFSSSVDGTTVFFNPTSSYDTNGTIVSYKWDFGDESNVTYPNNRTVRHTYVQDYKTYHVILVVTDSGGKNDTFSQDVTINDTTKPTIKIVKPVKALYLKNKIVRPFLFRMALIIGDINIEVKATDVNGSGLKYAQLWIGKQLVDNQTSGLINYTWKRDRFRLIHIYTIKVVAIDNAGNRAITKMLVRKYL